MKCRLQIPLLVFLVSVFFADVSRADKRVLMIGLDGAGGNYLRPGNTPNIDALAANGTIRYDFLNEAALDPDHPNGLGDSGPNWATINTGTGSPTHGVVGNGNREDIDLVSAPHWFKYIKDYDPSLYTASISSLDWINDVYLPDQYSDLEIDVDNDNLIRDEVVNLLNTGDPNAVFVHLHDIDTEGHANDWGSSQYFDTMETTDGRIGDIISALNARPGVISGSEDWLVLVTSDHGAKFGASSHSGEDGPMDWEVPFVASGPSVSNGSTMEQGTLRDLVPTALWHLGIDPFATEVEGNVMAITRAPNGIEGDVNQDGVISGNGQGPAETDDVTAFVEGWMNGDYSSAFTAYMSGDLNLDRKTDLADWTLLNQLHPALGQAVMNSLNAVPEPSAISMALFLLVTALSRRTYQ